MSADAHACTHTYDYVHVENIGIAVSVRTLTVRNLLHCEGTTAASVARMYACVTLRMHTSCTYYITRVYGGGYTCERVS